MSDKTIWIIVVVVALVIVGLIMGRRLKLFKVKGGGFSAEAQADTAGPVVERATAAGKKNRITADGAGALVRDVDAIGEENVISAGAKDQTGKPKR